MKRKLAEMSTPKTGMTRLVHEEMSVDGTGIYLRSSLESEFVNVHTRNVRIMIELFIEKNDETLHHQQLTLVNFYAKDFLGDDQMAMEYYKQAKESVSIIFHGLAAIAPDVKNHSLNFRSIDKKFFPTWTPFFKPESKATSNTEQEDGHEQDTASDESFIPEFLKEEFEKELSESFKKDSEKDY